MSRDCLPKCFLLLLLLLPKCWAAYDFVTLGDTPGLVKDNNRNILVCMVGDSIDHVCNADAAIYPPKTFQWEINGKVVKEEGEESLMIEKHYKIMNITKDMDDCNITCKYSIYQGYYKGRDVFNEWSVTVELAVFKLTVQATNITCENGVGDLQLSFKEARKNRNDQANLETKIKSMIEDLTGLSFSYGYSVTVPFKEVINSERLIAMNPTFIIDGTPTASCPKFKEVPKIDKRCPTEAAQQLEPGLDSEDDKTHKKKKHKNEEMKISSITPNEAQTDVKIIILGENLPQPGEISVVFSTPEWTKEVKPVNQHHHHALEVFTPKLDHKILHKTKVSVKLVSSSNQTETVEIFLLPAMETHQDSPPKQDPENNDQCSTKAAQIGTYVVMPLAAVFAGVFLIVWLYRRTKNIQTEDKNIQTEDSTEQVWTDLCHTQDVEENGLEEWMDGDGWMAKGNETDTEETSTSTLGSKQQEPEEEKFVLPSRPKKIAKTKKKKSLSDEPLTKKKDMKKSSENVQLIPY
eukprot:GFUD01134042.1.p1 GENE.GFUD01134042.1~~GFUD01134042.1.p1  ORF type:complete len:535 (+),score=139.30 GFUD01134042.1:47-1606(+)